MEQQEEKNHPGELYGDKCIFYDSGLINQFQNKVHLNMKPKASILWPHKMFSHQRHYILTSPQRFGELFLLPGIDLEGP